jgi:hypothetical protein
MKRTIAALLAGVALGAGVPAGYALTVKSPPSPVVVHPTRLGPIVDIKSIDLRCYYTTKKDAMSVDASNGTLAYDPSAALDCSRLSAGPPSRSVWFTQYHVQVSDETGAFYRSHFARTP